MFVVKSLHNKSSKTCKYLENIRFSCYHFAFIEKAASGIFAEMHTQDAPPIESITLFRHPLLTLRAFASVVIGGVGSLLQWLGAHAVPATAVAALMASIWFSDALLAPESQLALTVDSLKVVSAC